ncbi:MAG: hypothetical protein SGBAC_010277 [Bacillariaceae sp.]
MSTTYNSRRRHRSKVSDPIQADPCSNVFIYQLGRMVEYFDNSCTSTVEGIHFPSDSTTVLGDMDTVDLEQMELDTIADTATITDTIGETVDTSYSASDIRPNYSYATDDGSTVFSASSRASYTTQSSFRKPSKSPAKGPVAKFRMVGRMHARVPETKTAPMNKSGAFEDSSIVTAPTDSSTSSKENDVALVENLQNTTIEEEKDEVASEVASEEGKTEALSPPQRTPSSASASNKAPQVVTPSPEQPKKPITAEEQKMDAAIMQGLDLCRRIRQSYQHPKSSPIQYQSSPDRTSTNEFDQIQEPSPDNEAPAPNVPKTKMYGDRASSPSNNTFGTTPNKSPAETAPSTTSAPKPKSGTRMSQKLKGIVPFGVIQKRIEGFQRVKFLKEDLHGGPTKPNEKIGIGSTKVQFDLIEMMRGIHPNERHHVDDTASPFKNICALHQ